MQQTDELFRLNGQSLLIEGYAEEAETIRGTVLDLAAADGYEVHALLFRSKPESRMQYRRVVNLAKSRLRDNPDLAPWTGDWKFFYDTSAARGTVLTSEQRDELARVMRLTPLTGVAVGIEAFAIRNTYRGVRKLTSVTDQSATGEEKYWVSGTMGEDDA